MQPSSQIASLTSLLPGVDIRLPGPIMRASLLTAVLAFAKLIIAANDSAPIVDLGYAQYQGLYNSSANVSYFLGVRYAQAPTGQ